MFRLGAWKSSLDGERIAEAQVDAGQDGSPHRALVAPQDGEDWPTFTPGAVVRMGRDAVEAERHPAMGSRDLRHMGAMGVGVRCAEMRADALTSPAETTAV